MTELTADNRRRLREEVEKRNYNIIWAGGEYPFNTEECEIIYINMDNQPAICKARYYCDVIPTGISRINEHRFVRISDLTNMENVVAWKRRAE